MLTPSDPRAVAAEATAPDLDPVLEEGSPVLEEGYYVRNFEKTLETVQSRYGDLLTEEEAAYASEFLSLPEASKRLYVRLILRKGPCFRRDLLSYSEIENLDTAAESLIAHGYLDRAEDADLGDLLRVLRRPELVELAAALDPDLGRGIKSLKRPELVAQLTGAELAGAAEQQVHLSYSIWRPLRGEILTLFRLLFFGNLGQDFSEFVVSDLGIVRYESYELSREHRLFRDRVDIEQALGLRVIRQQVYALLDEGGLDEAVDLAKRVLGAQATWRQVVRRHVDEVLIQVGRRLERVKRYQDALELYAGAGRPPARERSCRALEYLGRREEALTLCNEMAAHPLDETESGFVPAFEHRLRKKLGLTQEPWRRPRRPTLEMTVVQGNKPVEVLALEALAAEGRPGVFSENWLWRSLFGLAFWDLIFAPVPGVFHHPFQMGPLDLSRPEFRARRADAIAGRLSEIASESDLHSRLWPIYEAKSGVANALVPWHVDLEHPLRFALQHVQGEALAIICDRLSSHLRRYRRGLPDLLVRSESSPTGFELLEVKGPGDQIRPEQGAWIDFLNQNHIPARVLKVSWA